MINFYRYRSEVLTQSKKTSRIIAITLATFFLAIGLCCTPWYKLHYDLIFAILIIVRLSILIFIAVNIYTFTRRVLLRFFYKRKLKLIKP